MQLAKLIASSCIWTACSAAGGLDPLHVDGRYIRDSANRVVILRGVVTITRNNDGKPLAMTGADYDRIQAWGSNVQQIRLEGCKLGLLPPCRPDPAYLDKLEAWVSMGEQRGLYTIFKATTYDIPGLGFLEQFRPGAWDKLWDTSSGWQDQFIAGWKPVWERFKGRPAVIGYDILNECSPGSKTPGFIHNTLFPFYRKAQAELARIDPRKLFVFQPPLRADDSLEPLGGENVLFAPHFYPDKPDPDGLYARILSDRDRVKAPMLFGEYGLPNVPFMANGRIIVHAFTPERDRGDALLFDRSSMGIIKTWYTSVGQWSLLTSEGNEHARLRYFSRPFPQRVAGVPQGFSFDFDSGEWNFAWEPDAAIEAPTLVFVPLKRHFPKGFEVAAGDAVLLTTDRRSSTGLRASGRKRAEAAAFRYDFATEILTLEPKKAPRLRSLKITPVR